ncbi:MAG: hypothetical protein QM734_08995 [Cyclobacteriaceae bacterium]
MISSTEEIETLEIYLQIEAMRFSDQFDYQINSILTEAERGAMTVPPMVAQPFIENAILHGLMPKKDNRKLTVTYYEDNGKFICEITDNGIGRKAAEEIKLKKKNHHQSKGMKLTYDRIKVFNNMYEKEMQVEVVDLVDEEQRPCGTRVKIFV